MRALFSTNRTVDQVTIDQVTIDQATVDQATVDQGRTNQRIIPRRMVTLGFATAVIFATVLMPSAATAQTVCPKCGKIHASATSNNFGVGSSTTVVTPAMPSLTTNSSNVSRSGVRSATSTSRAGRVVGGVSNVLSRLNAQRARQGIGALSYDPSLQAVAQQRAQQMASMGLKSHPPGSFSPGRYEGVGWSSSFTPGAVMACYTSDPSMVAAGAAMATGNDGVYFAVVYR